MKQNSHRQLIYDKDVYSHSPEAITRQLRGSQRNAIHKNDSLSSLDCPLNPSLGVTLDPISKSEQNQLSTVDEPQRGKRRGGRIKRKRKEERICTAHGGKERSRDRRGWLICHTCELTNRQTAAEGRAPEQRRALSTATRHTMSPPHCTAS